MPPDAPQANSPFWWIWERATTVHSAAYKLSNGRVGGKAYGVPVVLVDSVGRKSGKRRTHPLLCDEQGENIVIVASKGGVDKHPAWYHNLKASPETKINWRGENRRVRARETEGAERQRLWDRMAEVYPTYNQYQSRTERQIPVIVLEPAA
ncbi:MAG: nitroreductase family deazaflavin-dependent oxidoreductase [Solirubrobacterales bacterium]|nr:nitroreductase family deazaflavin-dependent oxidoreductase [Solirubrobacterales bacterium]